MPREMGSLDAGSMEKRMLRLDCHPRHIHPANQKSSSGAVDRCLTRKGKAMGPFAALRTMITRYTEYIART